MAQEGRLLVEVKPLIGGEIALLGAEQRRHHTVEAERCDEPAQPRRLDHHNQYHRLFRFHHAALRPLAFSIGEKAAAEEIDMTREVPSEEIVRAVLKQLRLSSRPTDEAARAGTAELLAALARF